MRSRKISIGFYLLVFILLVAWTIKPFPLYVLIPIGLFYITIVIWGSFSINSGYHISTICNGKGEGVAITFDDAPSHLTTTILELLKKYNAKATFFCIGKNIIEFPHIVTQIDNEGHLIGNHSYSHSVFFDFLSFKNICQEISKTNNLITNEIGKTTLFFRPPYGVTNPAIAKATKKLNLHIIGWSIRSFDTMSKNRKTLLRRVINKISSGDIILFHDRTEITISILEELLQHLKDNNIPIIPLEKFIDIKAYA